MDVISAFSGFSDDTQVKTNHGWQFIRDVDIDYDKVLTLDPKELTVQYTKPERLIRGDVNEYLFHFTHSTEDMLVTGHQKMLVRRFNQDLGYEFVTARETKGSYKLPIRGFKDANKSDNDESQYFIMPAVRCGQKEVSPERKILMFDWLEFFGFWLTCGYCKVLSEKNKRSFCVGIKKREEDDAYVLRLFERIGYPAKIRRESGYTLYETDSEQLFNYLAALGEECDRYVPGEFLESDHACLEHFLLGCEMGMVRIYDDFIVYLSKSKQVIEGIQELILRIYGSVGQIRTQYMVRKGQDIKYWYIRACTNDKIAHYATQYRKPELISYKGSVWNLELKENLALFVRRNDVVSWSGCCYLSE